jgi:hypothetical protein
VCVCVCVCRGGRGGGGYVRHRERPEWGEVRCWWWWWWLWRRLKHVEIDRRWGLVREAVRLLQNAVRVAVRKRRSVGCVSDG